MLSRLLSTAFSRSNSRTHPRLPSLPPELIDHILEYLEVDIISRDPTPKSRATAFACCRVSRQFLPFGRRMLYAKVLIAYGAGRNEGKMRPVRRLISTVLYHNKHLLDVTSSIHVRGSLVEAEGLMNFLFTYPIASVSLEDLPWQHGDPTLSAFRLIEVGKHLETLHIGSARRGAGKKVLPAVLHGHSFAEAQDVLHLRRFALTRINALDNWSPQHLQHVTELSLAECAPSVTQALLQHTAPRLTRLEVTTLSIKQASYTFSQGVLMLSLTDLLVTYSTTPSEQNYSTQAWRSALCGFLAFTPMLEQLELRFTKRTAEVLFEGKLPELCLGVPESVQNIVLRLVDEGGSDYDGLLDRGRADFDCEEHKKSYICYGLRLDGL